MGLVRALRRRHCCSNAAARRLRAGTLLREALLALRQLHAPAALGGGQPLGRYDSPLARVQLRLAVLQPPLVLLQRLQASNYSGG